jgi:ribosomal protein S18 acetylase RimI-like enzyme
LDDGPVEIRVETYDASTARLTAELRDLYGAVYVEAPYHDGSDDIAEFVAEWPDLLAPPGFGLALARVHEEHAQHLAGFALGHAVEPGTDWWPTNFPEGDKEASFGIAELGVRPERRRHGIARLVHDALLAGRPERQVVLWVRGDAPAATAAYRRWGYRIDGDAPGRPPYLVMCLNR